MNRIKFWVGVLCIVLAVGTLPSIYLISRGLLEEAVSSEDATHFQIKLVIYVVEVAILVAGAFLLLKRRRSK